ncbi:MAG: recombinase family protein [Blautia sp.]
MIEDAKAGKIDTIIVKDFSRFGRDYIGVGDYLEQILPILGIRFISVNNNYDSNDYFGKTMGMDMAIHNLVNNLYSKDISKEDKKCVESEMEKRTMDGRKTAIWIFKRY